jgi:DNA-binding CsgD family transcriptional regulator
LLRAQPKYNISAVIIVNGVPTAVTTDNADRRVDAVDEPSSPDAVAEVAPSEPGRDPLVRARGLIPTRGRRTGPPDALPDGMAECYWAVVVHGPQRHVPAKTFDGRIPELVTGVESSVGDVNFASCGITSARGRDAPASPVRVTGRLSDYQQARRLAELANLVEGPRAGLAARWANALGHDDGDALLEVSRDLEAMGARIAAADAAAQASLTFHRHTRRGSALTAAGRAGRIITDCGSTTPATRATAAPLPLTERQREVATLVSDGLYNKEIAEAQTVSVRTVEGHIYQACVNVGVANRTELGRLLAEFRSHRPADQRRPKIDPFSESRGNREQGSAGDRM